MIRRSRSRRSTWSATRRLRTAWAATSTAAKMPKARAREASTTEEAVQPKAPNGSPDARYAPFRLLALAERNLFDASGLEELFELRAVVALKHDVFAVDATSAAE